MTNVNDLTIAQIESIKTTDAVEAIEKAIWDEIKDGTWYRAFSGVSAQDLRAYIGDDVYFDFRADLPESTVFESILEDFTEEERDAMTDEARSEAELTAASSITVQYIDQGLARHIWTGLVEQAERRAA
ncbi:MAG TPA: hypothetical protein VGO06_16020 [Bosea sp. (in: a-proteobacteria)]|jgi:hypothetical protein|uniref:hypothetical protein n=1 Tax=Bosea sp. (in: a-proteobacteria) TaxID=1871050 RepID=UPI002E0FA782|nr:hypothetical protein [Bosea sp. (in: a-proteobacteria)]